MHTIDEIEFSSSTVDQNSQSKQKIVTLCDLKNEEELMEIIQLDIAQLDLK